LKFYKKGAIMDTSAKIKDKLTCLFNPQYFRETLHRELEKARKNSRNLSILICDLDFFKKVNDDFTHPKGDIILKQSGEIIKSLTGDKYIPCRHGGDEFSVICVNTEKEEALRLAEKIRKAIEEQDFILDMKKIKITLTTGVGTFPDNGSSAGDLLRETDFALHYAKMGGRNRVRHASENPPRW